MQDNKTKTILEALQQGRISVDDALLQLKLEPFQDLGYAKVDHHRRLRQGVPEVIYGAGKTPEQMVGIVSAMQEAGQETVLITRLSPEAAEIVGRTHPMTYHEMGRIATIGPLPEPDGLGTIVIATGAPAMCPWRKRQPSPPRPWATGFGSSTTWAWPGCTGFWPIWSTSWTPASSSPLRGWRGPWPAW